MNIPHDLSPHNQEHIPDPSDAQRESPVGTSVPVIEPALLYNAVAQASEDAIYAKSLDGTITAWNPGAQRLYGYSAHEAIGCHVTLLVPDERRDEVSAIMQQIGRGESVQVRETVRRRKDGQHVVVRLTIVPVRSKEGTVVGASVIAHELADQWQSEARFRAVVEASPHGMVMVNAAGQIVLVNGEVERLFGYTRAELVGSVVECLLPDRFHATHQGHRQRFMAHTLTHFMGPDNELYGRRKDGSEFPVEVRLSPIPTSEGLYTLAAVVDITERKRAAASVYEAEQKLRTLIELLPIGITILDTHQRPLYINAALERIIHLSLPALQRGEHQIRRYIYPDGSPMPPAAFASTRALVEQRPIYDVETGVVGNNGSLIWTSVSAAPVNIADWKLVVVTADISARKHAEEAVRITEAVFTKAFHASPVAVLLTRLADTCILDANTRALSLLGYRREEVIGQPMVNLDFWQYPTRYEALLQQLKEHGRIVEEEVQIRTLSAEIRDVVLSAEIIEIGGEPVVLLLLHDITDRKQAAKQLEVQAQELQRSNDDLEQFAYIASHDLQEPLRMVASYTELLSERYTGRLDEKADKYIYYAVDGARRMQQLINDLLAYSRLGQQAHTPRVTRSSEVLQQVLRVLQLPIRSSRANVHVGSLPEVLADPVQLGQLLQNLISNAIKFCDERDPIIEVRATARGDTWEFAVADNGIGIAPENAERIFHMFQRLHNRSKYSGNGIGLAIAKRIVERHGGHIWFTSVPGTGTTFFFTLPTGLPATKGDTDGTHANAHFVDRG